MFDVLLAAQGVHDRCLEPVRERDDLVMGTRDPGAGEDRHGVAGIQELRSGLELALAGNDARPGRLDGGRGASLGRLLEEDVAGHDDHGDAALLHGRAHRRLQHPRELSRVGDEFAVVAALAEQLLRVGLLEVGGADLGRRDVRGDRQHRNPAAVRVEQAVDEVQVAGSAASGDDGELAGDLRLRRRGERGRLLVPHVHPGDVAGAQRIREGVQRVAGKAPHPFDAGALEDLDGLVGDGLCHGSPRFGLIPRYARGGARSRGVDTGRR